MLYIYIYIYIYEGFENNRNICEKLICVLYLILTTAHVGFGL